MRRILLFLCISLLAIGQLDAQTRTVTGKVTDDKGTPLSGVSVTELGTDRKVLSTTVTNETGTFSVKVSNNTRGIQIASVGFVEQFFPLGGIRNNSLDVRLTASVDNLADVVVTTAGGLKTRKKDIGTASTQVSAATLTAAKPVNVAAGLAGKVAGLTVSATSSGVNPNFRVILRGQRSLTGNNQALIVLDNVIVPNDVLGNLNPEDVEDIVVLNGASGAALYGSDASNGALLITTKKGSKSKVAVKVANTLTIEQVAFYPKLQNRFGSGSTADIRVYTPDENQQYGPEFDGIVRPIGQPLADGTIQMVPYSPTDGKKNFWQLGLNNQTDLSISGGDERGTNFLSVQYVDGVGTTPKDKYNRTTVRYNGTRQFTRTLTLNMNSSYAQNRYDITSQTSNIYGYLMQTPAQIDVTQYKDWKTNKYADPSGYYNPFYENPYFLLDNYRQGTRNDYFTANGELKFAPLSWVDFTYRLGISTRNVSSKTYSDIFRYSDFAKATTHGSYKKTDKVGGVTDASSYTTRLTSEFQASFRKKIQDFNLRLVTAATLRQDQSKSLSASVSGLVVPGLFNLSNTLNNPTADESNFKARQLGAYYDLNIGYKGFLNIHTTGRNDWVSTLAPENRSFFYPSVDVAFTPMDAIPALKEMKALNSLKIRASWSKVGQVNLTGTFGAYALDPTFGQAAGFPYPIGGGFTVGNRIVSNNLKPEMTKQWEVGADFGLFKNRITGAITYYSNKTTDQTVSTSVSSATGYTTYLLNAAATSGSGLEFTASTVPLRTKDWELTVGGNYSYVIKSNVDAITSDVKNLSLGSISYAVVGQPFPVLLGTAYKKDPLGRVIVDPITGYPSRSDTNSVLGSAVPKHTLALNISLRYKNFRFSALGEYRGGYQTYMPSTTAFDFSGGGQNTVAFNRERFVFPNSVIPDPNKPGEYLPNNNITVRDGGYNFWAQSVRTGVNENYVISGAFWKIREITLSYDVPQSALQRVKFIKNLTISAQARNVFMFFPKTNMYTDPEFSDNGSTSNGVGVAGISNAPPSRYYGASISITF
ncbi:SusC/RagA family TonB-linked outer membrane protein [Sediminibacterium ginsengisoli]|uniref:TonB-linked outer membrane protein, SusC/RagA family n=1 Tax=Sediminibacterium ginsengisoli TaxID=413434 RepID=A0A1T4RVB1_9BACT|nr:SusC/RagA family TonB-linked outer membrane protein [Sediminibacterium ginsengisoli]SKA19929.1 TonB-linked outer membrane protein, SusC/RagA family [Sediminibacterium ginsengisoli]